MSCSCLGMLVIHLNVTYAPMIGGKARFGRIYRRLESFEHTLIAWNAVDVDEIELKSAHDCAKPNRSKLHNGELHFRNWTYENTVTLPDKQA